MNKETLPFVCERMDESECEIVEVTIAEIMSQTQMSDSVVSLRFWKSPLEDTKIGVDFFDSDGNEVFPNGYVLKLFFHESGVHLDWKHIGGGKSPRKTADNRRAA